MSTPATETMRSMDNINPGDPAQGRENNVVVMREMDVDRRQTLRDMRYGTQSMYVSEHLTGTVFIRVAVQDLKVQKCLQFELEESVWEAKQRILAVFAKDLKDALNYGLYMPPMNGRAGKFLDEERLLREYPLHGPIGFVEFKYKRRVYKLMHINARKLRQLHTKGVFRQCMDHIKQGNISKVNKMTTKGLDPNFHDSNGETPLSVATGLGKDKCREMIIALFSGGAHLDFRTRQGQTPIHKAVLNGNQTSVQALLDLGASTNYKDGKGLTPLYYSVLYGKNANCAEILLHERALIGCRDENGWCEVHQACKLGLVQHLEHLMFYGADLDVTNASGNTPLHICAVNNNEQCARILLFRGANKNISNYNNQTPQQVAVVAGNISLAEIIKNFDEADAVPFREMPTYSKRRPRLSMYDSTLSLISRSRSDPKLNISSAVNESHVISPPESMRSLPQHYNVYSDSGSYSASRGSDSPRSMSISSNSSGPGSTGTITGPSPLTLTQYSQLHNAGNQSGSGTLKAQQPLENPYAIQKLKVSSVDPDDDLVCGKHATEIDDSSDPHFHLILQKRLLELKTRQDHDVKTAPLSESDKMANKYTCATQKVKYDKNKNNPFFTLQARRKISEGSNSVRVTRPERRKYSEGSYRDNFSHFMNSDSVPEEGGDENSDDRYEFPELEEAERRRVSFLKASYFQNHMQASSDNEQSDSSRRLVNMQSGNISESMQTLGEIDDREDFNELNFQGQILHLKDQDRMFVCVESYDPQDPVGLKIKVGDVVTVSSVTDTGFWEGSVNDREGWFPAHHVQEVRLRNKAGSMNDLLSDDSVDFSMHHNRNTLARLMPPDMSDYGPRTVVLQRAPEGYGFVLRGAKSQLKPNGELDFRPTAEFPALQYLDSVDPGSVSDRAGLHGGDFILEINGENVIKASHDRVVHLIRSTGDTLAMKVVTVQPSGGRADWFNGDKSMTMPHKMKKKAPVPPQRDPRTSISISKSEGQSISDELSAMASLDSAISGKPEDKIASIRSRTAAKRVSVIDAENIGVDGTLGRAKSTPDLFEGSKIYASPTVPDNKKSNVYAVPGVNASTSGSPVGVAVRPKASPPPPPGEDNSPKKKAPKPPANTSFESSSSTEVVTINTNKSSPYASTKVLVKSTTKSESPYESSFRPGDSAKMSEEPKDLTGYKAGHKRTPSAGALLNRENTEQSQDTNGGVTFAEDKVLDHAASFLKKHPNAKLLMTAKGQESLRKRTSIKMEPAPDYDSDSGDEKPQSPVKFRDYKQRQSVTVISVGDKNQKPSPTQSQASKRYTIHSTIPSDDKGFSIPPRPNGPAPTPPSQNRQDTQSRKSAAPTPPQDNKVTVKVEVNREPEDNFYAPKLPDSQPPSLPSTPPPDFDDKPFLREIPRAPAPPPVAPAPPPPPPPPPAPSAEDINKVKSTASADHISSKPVSQDAIAAAVAKRQERLHNQEPKIFDNKPKPVVPQMDPNQAAIIAAVARRRQQLEKQDQHSVMESIESRLQKTKKLQAAKFSLTGSKVAKTDNKNNESANKSNVQSNVKGLGSVKKPEPAKAEKEEFSFKVEPIKELPKIIKNQPGITQIKPNFGQRPVKSASETKQANGIGVNKPKPIENVIVKPAPATNKDKLSEVKNETDNEQTKSEKNVNGQSDFLALAEKRRQEWLQRKQKSSESKSSSASGSPDKERFRNGEKKGVSPQVSAKPSKPLTNGDVYANVPPPPAAFRDGGNTDNNNIVQLEIIPPPMHFSSEHGHETSSQQHSPAFSPDTASLVSSLSTLSSLSGEGRGNGYEDVIAPPPPGFDDGDTSVIPPPPQFDSLTDKKAGKSFGDKPVSDWLCNDVLDWLDSLSMSQYKSSFQRNCIDGKKLLGLSRNHYIDLGVTQVGHRMTIERSIKKAEIKQKNLSNNVIASEHL
ncbi:SH3 and multiple ankyrin repeat domains protein 2-like isoform X2 [Mya arenaria]|uniref:SH3 and multiple ankyrin repeat domains protein 2-like isoform X2 n=1 Tax=Mya arenaria TaxID=6604 RepID=UPI0022E0D887|nr:SH3 and multiple ankyrin repeat domains protein 2-like isoform X2 [Mya arenaria]